VTTRTSTLPIGPGGGTASISVSVLVMKDAGWEPNSTWVAPLNPVPETLTATQPVGGPVAGRTVVTTGRADDMYVYRSPGLAADVPAGDVTVTSTAPLPEGAVAVI
jgi:hypothetical protein